MQGDFLIGERLVQPRINCLQHQGSTVHLEPKIMQVLLVLASKPGEVFTREDIRNVVWRDVFVGDDVLMRAVSEIRRAFDDDPRTPHTVQTVPKVGYRLIAPVETLPASAPAPERKATIEPVTDPVQASAVQLDLSPALQNALTEPSVSPRGSISPRGQRTSWHWPAAVAGMIAILCAVAAGLFSRNSPNTAHASSGTYRSHPLTTYPGSQVQPALSPGGDAIAFLWNGTGHDGNHVYVRSLRSDVPVRITSGSGQEFNPAWSPDGQSIAFVRSTANQAEIDVVPALGGSERAVYRLPINSVQEYGGLTWTADGNSLIFPQQVRPDGPSELVRLSLADHSLQRLTSPPANWNGDLMPGVSPDGTMLAFARGPERSTRDIFVMQLPDGKPRQLTADAHLILGLAWSADGSNIVFSSNRGGSPGLWRVPVSGGVPEREMAGSDGAYAPTISRRGDLLAYTHGTATWSIVSVPLDSKASDETEVLTSSEQDASPQISPTGDKLAFQSWRSGMQEIWTSAQDGSNPVQLTTQGASAGSPAWSNDGHWIAFDARPDGFPHIYIVDPNGGQPRAITTGHFSDVVPSWSADDRWIYFGSNRSGTWQIWRVASDGSGHIEQVTSNGGMVARESRDGVWLYYSQIATPGIWRRKVAAGPEQKIFEGPPLGNQDYWNVSGDHLYVLAAGNEGRALVRVDPESQRIATVYKLKHDPTPFAGLTVTPDGKHLLFAELMQAESNITLVERYR